MRVGLIADTHGNLVALDEVLAELDRDGVDLLVCLGDVAAGPQPAETVDRLRELGAPVVMGNWDAHLLGHERAVPGELAPILVDICAWSGDQLSADQRAYMSSFEPTLELELADGVKLLAFHGSPRSCDDAIYATTPDEELEQLATGYDATVFAGAHTHFQLFRRFGESVFVNPGSVGLPFRRRQVGVMYISPWAEYAVARADDRCLAVELRRTTYDVERFLETMRRSGMPHVERWSALWGREAAATSA
jgi:putative phosphoesterase